MITNKGKEGRNVHLLDKAISSLISCILSFLLLLLPLLYLITQTHHYGSVPKYTCDLKISVSFLCHFLLLERPFD